MASSVEMPSAPFGCVLRDHNRRDRCRETNARATMGAFQKNLKSLVRDHLCIAVSPKSGSNDSNSENQNGNNDDSWVRNDKEASSCSKKDENGNEREDGMTPRHARVLDRWAFARQMVSKPVERRRSAEADVFANNDENSNRNREREDESGSVMSPRHVRVLDRWAFARQMVAKPIERQRSAEAEVYSVPNSAPSSTRTSTSKEETIARTDSLVDLTKKGVGASSLVQIWEKRLHKSDTLKTNSNGNEISETSRSSSGVSSTENDNESNASPPRVSGAEKAESPVQKTEDSVEKAGDLVFSIEAGDSDFHMEKAAESIDESYDPRDSFEDSDGIAVVDSQNLDAKEKEKGRVVDIIRRLTAQGPSSSLSTEDTSNDHDQQYGSTQSSPCRELLRERSGVDQAENKGLSEHKGLSHVLNSSHATSSPRLRGRQAFADLLMQFERDRHKELDTLVNQKTVSTFPQRGRTRIQSLLRLRLLKRGMAFVGSDAPPLPPKPSRVNKPAQGSSIMHLREKFCTSVEQGTIVQDDAPNSNSLQKDITKNTSVNVDKSSTCNKPSESTPNREVKVMEKQKTSAVLLASKDVCDKANPSLDRSSTSIEPVESTTNREVKVMEQQKTSTVLRASENVCEEATSSLDKSMKSSTSSKPSECTLNREGKVMEQLKASLVLRASENVCEERTPSSDKSSSNKPSERVNVMEQQKTSPVLRASENVCKEPSPPLEVTFRETSAAAQSTLPNVSEDLRQETSLVAKKLDVQETANPTTTMSDPNVDEIWKPKCSEARILDSQERADTRTALSGGAENGNEICEGTSSEARNLDAQEIADTTSSLNSWNDTRLEAGNFDSQENLDTTTSMVDWDENDDDYQYYGETNYDWISEISRPRSYWEDIRKSWYQEMLNSSSEKGEIHQLLERRTVSSFLTSDFRDKIDRLMVSRVERQTCHRISQEEEEEEDDESSYDRMNQMVSFLQQRTSASGAKEEAEEVQEHVQVQEQNQVQEQVTENVQVQEQNQVQEQVKEHVQVQEQNQVQEQVLDYVQVHKQVPKHQDQEDLEMTEEEEEEENDDNDDDDEESRSLISGQFLEASDYFDRASLQPSPSHFTTWSYQDNEVGDDSDGATSASPRQQSPFRYSPQRSPPQSYNASHQQGSPSLSHPLMEMELMYNMKGHMIQLYQEMSELRKAIKSCVDMQMTMQESMKQDAQSVQVGKKRNSNGFTKKGNCRICNEAKIDSLLYRCGHMCTCLKCAHDLQWNSGKCPICQAPIADVVRAYMDS